MEHAQRDTEKNVSSAKEFVVLILILMEHAQRVAVCAAAVAEHRS